MNSRLPSRNILDRDILRMERDLINTMLRFVPTYPASASAPGQRGDYSINDDDNRLAIRTDVEWKELDLEPVGLGSDPTFDSVTVTDLTANRIVATDGDKKLASVASLTNWIAGTANRITVSNDGDGSVTLNLPDVPTLEGLNLDVGSDTDIDLVTVGVTGSPKWWWDESEDLFAFSKGLAISGLVGIGMNPGDATLSSTLDITSTVGTGVQTSGSAGDIRARTLCWSATDSHRPRYQLIKSGTDTIGTWSTTADGEWIGSYEFWGVDTNNSPVFAGWMRCEQENAAGSGGIQANMIFQTANYSTGDNLNHMVLRHDNTTGLNTATPVSMLEMYNAATNPIFTITAAHNFSYDPQIHFRTDGTPTVKAALGVDGGSDYFHLNMGNPTGGVGGGSQWVWRYNPDDNATVLGIGVATPALGTSITNSYSTTQVNQNIFSMQNLIYWTPDQNANFDLYGMNFGVYMQAHSYNTRRIYGGRFAINLADGWTGQSLDLYAYDMSINNLNTTGGAGTITNDMAAFRVTFGAGTTDPTVSGDAYQVYLGDYSSAFSVSGGSYGIRQLGNTLINDFDGEIYISQDSNYLRFGTAQDAGFMYNGSHLRFYSQLVGSGDFQFMDGKVDFQMAMGNSTKDPTTDAPVDWVEVKIGGTTRYLPAYAA